MVLPDCVAVSQLALSATVQLSVPVPEFVTEMVLEAGLLPPAVPLKAKLVGLSPIAFALIFQLLNPSYFDAFWQSSLAPTMVAMGLMSEAIGFMFVWRISKIKV